jgi:hypothetical protein
MIRHGDVDGFTFSKGRNADDKKHQTRERRGVLAAGA